MMPAPETVVGQVIGVLAEQVLPDMPPATWGAANVRAAIALLTYVQDALTGDPAPMEDANSAMKALFAAAEDLGPDTLDAGLRTELAAALGDDATGKAAFDARQVLLAALVRQSAGKRTPTFQAQLRAVIEQVNEADFPPVSRASVLPPF